MDGGIDADTVGSVAEAGATLFVAGSAVFGDPDPAEAYQRIAPRQARIAGRSELATKSRFRRVRPAAR